MDSDIQFGDLEEARPEVQLRPDQNRHYAVVPVGRAEPGDLPIFVDLDAMLDMEDHALSDTSVELGGVLLGGQYEDREGQPFVVVTDSLRARHYQSTKGSFKFTHDTWEEITRERDQFPDELQMVGWYHTHPDWGVFLSGMDMFICDNFFSRLLDVALVIDPCRQDRGMFYWTGRPGERIRRAGAFYLMASRFREVELEQIASLLEEPEAMAETRWSGGGRGVSPAPVVNIADRSPWPAVAMFGMLMVQTLFVGLIAWKMIGLEPEGDSASLRSLAARDDLEGQRKLLDQVVSRLGDHPSQVVSSLEEARQKNERLSMTAQGLEARVRELQRERELTQKGIQDNEKRIAGLQTQLDRLEQSNEEKLEQVKQLKGRLAKYESVADDADAAAVPWYRDWKYQAAIGALLALVAASAFWAVGKRPLLTSEAMDARYAEPDSDANDADALK